MIFHKGGQHRLKRPLLAISLLASLSVSVSPYSQEVNDETLIVPPENWYQVEVILFTQDANTSGELPPKEYQLNFPDNLVELVDTKARADEEALAIEGALMPDIDELPLQDYSPFAELIPLIEMQDPADDSVIFDTEMPLNIDSSEDWLDTLTPPLEAYVPEYEKPFELLNSSERNLNDSARMLGRRSYNVIFHEAWRFVADENSQDPWLIVSSGKKVDDRAEIEGGLRFYKARFLHFETNLWRLNFDDQEFVDGTNLITLPDMPISSVEKDPDLSWRLVLAEVTPEQQYAENEIMTPEDDVNSTVNFDTVSPSTEANSGSAGALNISQQLATINLADTVLTAQPETAVVGISALELTGYNYTLEQFDATLEPLEIEPVDDKKYAVSAVWPINQSKRIEEAKVYYLDHPELGIMLTIKSYDPEPINPKPTIADDSILPLIE